MHFKEIYELSQTQTVLLRQHVYMFPLFVPNFITKSIEKTLLKKHKIFKNLEYLNNYRFYYKFLIN